VRIVGSNVSVSRPVVSALPESKEPITGHIDVVQARNGFIHLLDYKPKAREIDPVNQLVVYALAFASRARLPVKVFKCAWLTRRTIRVLPFYKQANPRAPTRLPQTGYERSKQESSNPRFDLLVAVLGSPLSSLRLLTESSYPSCLLFPLHAPRGPRPGARPSRASGLH
jgi:hypothetical protein